MSVLFFLLSGEHPTLPSAELRAVLESGKYRARVLVTLPQVMLIEADRRCIDFVVSRCSMMRVCGFEIFDCDAELNEILRHVREASVQDLIRRGESFQVRVKRVRGSSLELKTEQLEREIGGALLESLHGVRVRLEKPDKTFLGILSGGKFVFGLKLAEVSAKPFMERRPRKRPFFHPTTMPPKLARCVVNLARAIAGQLLLDPFCGAGGILLEAGLIGCRVVGADVKDNMVKGSWENLRHFGVAPFGIVKADARKPPFRRVNCIVTDPPYGRGATTLGLTTRQLVSNFLRVVKDLIPKGGFLCIAAPKTVRTSNIGRRKGFKLVEEHYVYVHRSLSREIAVFKKM